MDIGDALVILMLGIIITATVGLVIIYWLYVKYELPKKKERS